MGDHVILLTDFNDNVTAPLDRRWAANIGLVDAISWLHPDLAPPTFQRGSQPINVIFIPPQLLTQAAGGYLSFDDAVPSDHQAIWWDVHLPEIYPLHQDGYTKPQACWLQCKDPWVVACYNQVLLDTLNQHNIPQWINQVNA